MEDANAALPPALDEHASIVPQESGSQQAADALNVGRDTLSPADLESEAGRKRSTRIGLMERKRREEDERKAREELEAQKRAEDKRVARIRKKYERLQYQQYPGSQGGEDSGCAVLA
jgi:hypothetical protein